MQIMHIKIKTINMTKKFIMLYSVWVLCLKVLCIDEPKIPSVELVEKIKKKQKTREWNKMKFSCVVKVSRIVPGRKM